MSQPHLTRPLNLIDCDEFNNQRNYSPLTQSQVASVQYNSSNFNQTANSRGSSSSNFNYMNLTYTSNQSENLDKKCFNNYANLNYLKSLPIYAKVDKKRKSNGDTKLTLRNHTTEVIQEPMGQFGDDKINSKFGQSNDGKIKEEDQLIDLETEIVFDPKHNFELPQKADLLSSLVSLVSLEPTNCIQASLASDQQPNLLSSDIITTPISTLISIGHSNDFTNCDQISAQNVKQGNKKDVNVLNCFQAEDTGKLKLTSCEVDNLIEKEVQKLLEQLVEKVAQSVDVKDDQSKIRTTEGDAFSEINNLFQKFSFSLKDINVSLQSKG